MRKSAAIGLRLVSLQTGSGPLLDAGQCEVIREVVQHLNFAVVLEAALVEDLYVSAFNFADGLFEVEGFVGCRLYSFFLGVSMLF